ncbi:MAG TPA: long-chain fatty acid--CoA ligase, partial [Ktedonobacterales bacterium]|nr:long-chain fatty acid--CoA ligase [Ktedonobacterales bacterium]
MATEVNLAQLFRNRSAQYTDKMRWREKRDGKLLSATFRENQQIVNRLIAGLDALGVRPGDVVGIVSDTRWEWMAADWAIIGLGAVTLAVYPSNMPATNSFILNDAGARFLFIEDHTQYDKLQSIRNEIPGVQKVIMFGDAEQVAGDPWTMSFDALLALSPRAPAEADALAAERAAAIRPEDRLTLVYTSGTTGRPKGVLHTHASFLAQLVGVRAMLDVDAEGMVDLLFLPLSHVFGREEHLAGVDRCLNTYVSRTSNDLAAELRSVKPELLFSVPRVYEKAYDAVIARVEAGPASRKRIFYRALNVGRAVLRRQQAGKRVPLTLRLRYRLADKLVFHKVREALGGNLKYAVTAAAPLDLNILEFFNAAGITLLEGWGLTETSGGFTLNKASERRLGTLGRAFPGHELRIADDGEILARGPCIFPGYNNNPEATAEAIDAQGWFHTGDIGSLDKYGYLRITDRKKDLIITAAGKNIAPQHVEKTLQKAPCVSQVAVYGDRRPYLVGVVTIDADAAQRWAAANNVSYSSLAEICANPTFRAYLDAGIQAQNAQLASYETMKYYDVL